ncbi:hypothetical protein NF867_08855 [Solitalea sp. MAHUQ-68]|uniref:Lipocalin-like domain-containing protein n=1 Tax=Solitalea agri TaxID=2953739 RepID=A0A9X2F2I9_9SPHI|nr:hypothetical protein [Solitalea agri]MCO4292969.1 hypothetical protein [Solitalea agri]
MKSLNILLVVVSLVTTVSCKKDRDADLTTKLTGSWEWVYSVGGLTGNQKTYPKETSRVVFTTDKTFRTLANGQTIREGKYDIVYIDNIFSTEKAPAIKFVDLAGNSEDNLFTITVDTLTFIDNHVEPFGHVYVRVKEVK